MAEGGEPGRDVPGGGTTRNTGARRTGPRDRHGHQAGRGAGRGPLRWIAPLAFVLLLLALLLFTTVPG